VGSGEVVNSRFRPAHTRHSVHDQLAFGLPFVLFVAAQRPPPHTRARRGALRSPCGMPARPRPLTPQSRSTAAALQDLPVRPPAAPPRGEAHSVLDFVLRVYSLRGVNVLQFQIASHSSTAISTFRTATPPPAVLAPGPLQFQGVAGATVPPRPHPKYIKHRLQWPQAAPPYLSSPPKKRKPPAGSAGPLASTFPRIDTR
jgi:hypothetical protein